MNKNISYKIVSLVFAILVICFAIAFYVVGWTEPTQAPPAGNVPAPLNTGPDGQSKQGGLILNTGGAANGLIVDQGNVGIGDTTPDGSLKLDVEGPVGATQYCDENGNNCRTVTGAFGGGYKLLAASSDWTEEAIFTITSSGITFETDYQYGGQRVNPVLFEWPSGINEIIFEVENDGDNYCVGGGGTMGLVSGVGTNAKCTDYQYQGTTLTKINRVEGDWIRLIINGNKINECPDQLARTPNAGYPGKWGDASYSDIYCIYSKSAGYWSGEITELKVEEVDWSPAYGMWEWRIWYK